MLHAFYPHTIKAHEDKSPWWYQTLRLSVRSLCTPIHLRIFLDDNIPLLQTPKVLTFAITILPAYPPQGPSTRVGDIAGPIFLIDHYRPSTCFLHYLPGFTMLRQRVVPMPFQFSGPNYDSPFCLESSYLGLVCSLIKDKTLSYPVSIDWIAQWFILHKLTKDVQPSNSSHGWLSSSVVCPL